MTPQELHDLITDIAGVSIACAGVPKAVPILDRAMDALKEQQSRIAALEAELVQRGARIRELEAKQQRLIKGAKDGWV